MYHFVLNGVKCACDDVHELLRATRFASIGKRPKSDDSFSVEITKSSPHEVWIGTAGEDLDAQIEKIMNADTDKKTSGSKRPKCHKRLGTIVKTPHELKDLPKLDGTITWDVAHRIGKKFKRTDLNQLRTDLKQRQQLP